MRRFHSLCAGIASIAFVGLVSAAAVPFTEDFSSSSSSWRDSTGTVPLDWLSAGGPDGGSYASGPFNFVNSTPNTTPSILRGHDSYNSSGDAFVGNWIAEGVTHFSMNVRHNAPEPLVFFARFATPANFPGAAAVEFAPVMPNTWTNIDFLIDPSNPQIVLEGFPFEDVFSNVGNIQIGVSVSATLAGVDHSYTFDVDKIGIVPEPATLLALGALVAALRRR